MSPLTTRYSTNLTVLVGVGDGVGEGVAVGVGEGDTVGVGDGFGVAVGVGEGLGVGAGVGVGLGVGAGVTSGMEPAKLKSPKFPVGVLSKEARRTVAGAVPLVGILPANHAVASR